MERKIGEIFTYNGKTYQVVKSIVCAHCVFRGKLCGFIESSAGNCMPSNRSDKTSVIFKEINNMEIKNNQLTIDIPEGMKIDLEIVIQLRVQLNLRRVLLLMNILKMP